MDAALSEAFFKRRLKKLNKPDGFVLYGKLSVDFFSISELLYPYMKIKLRLIKARLNFTGLAMTPNLVLEKLIARFTLVVLLSRLSITKKEWIFLHLLLWSSTIWIS